MRNWRLWLGVVVSAACLYLSARGIDWPALGDTLRHVQWIWLVPASLCLVGGMVARAYRWQSLLQPLPKLSTRRLFHILNVGYLLNNILPVRLGDVVKAYLCAELGCIEVGRALSTVVVERVADVMTIGVLLLLILPSTALPEGVVTGARTAGVPAVLLSLLLFAVILRGEQSLVWLDRVWERMRLPGRLWLGRQMQAAVRGLAALGSWRGFVGLVFWSLVIWVSAGLQFWACFPAAGLSLPFGAALAVLCVTSLGMVIPSSPGYIGVFEYLTVLTLSAFSVPAEQALGYALVLHGSMYLLVVALGVMSAAVEGLSYARLRETMATRGSLGVTN